MSKPISDRKLAANRRNARRSTGPRTAQGKAKASGNAVTHGILAQQFLILVGEGKEDQSAYNDLQCRLRAEHRPVGVLEELLLEQLGNEIWRLRRVNLAEQGAIQRRVERLRAGEALKQRQQFLESQQSAPVLREPTSADLRNGVQGLDRLITRAQNHFPVLDEPLRVSDVPPVLEKVVSPLFQTVDFHNAESVEVFTEHLMNGRREWTQLQQEVETREKEDLEAKRARLMVPSPNDLDRILRYKTAAERSIQRIVAQLKDLQNARNNGQARLSRPRVTESAAGEPFGRSY